MALDVVPITSLDRPRLLRYDVNSLADMELHLGIGPAEIFKEERVGLATIRGLLWAGLKWQDKRLTPDAVGDMLGVFIKGKGNPMDLMVQIMHAINASGLMTVELQQDEVEGEKVPLEPGKPEESPPAV